MGGSRSPRRCVPAPVSPSCRAAPGPRHLGTPGMPVPIPPCPSACPADPRAANPEAGPAWHHLLIVDLPSQHLGRHPVRGAHHGQRLLLAALAGGHSRTSGALSPCPSPQTSLSLPAPALLHAPPDSSRHQAAHTSPSHPSPSPDPAPWVPSTGGGGGHPTAPIPALPAGPQNPSLPISCCQRAGSPCSDDGDRRTSSAHL